jgi:hypothetical protein
MVLRRRCRGGAATRRRLEVGLAGTRGKRVSGSLREDQGPVGGPESRGGPIKSLGAPNDYPCGPIARQVKPGDWSSLGGVARGRGKFDRRARRRSASAGVRATYPRRRGTRRAKSRL